MIWDCFPFRNELDLLECRLTEFDGYGLEVNHVLVESVQDFYGRKKPLYYMMASDEGRFSKWWDRIFHVVTGPLPDAEDPWVREHYQRDQALTVLDALAKDEDLVLICDGDEIVAKRILETRSIYVPSTPVGLLMATCHSAVDWLYPAEMPGSVVAPWACIKERKLSEVRDGRPSYPQLHGGGWHLSWLGGPQAQAEKLTVSCHRELSSEERAILSEGHGYRTGNHVGVTMVPAEVNETWPRYIWERKCPPSWFRPRG